MAAPIAGTYRSALARVRQEADSLRRRVVGTQPEGCPISWKPSVFTPVFYGYEDVLAVLPPVVATAAQAASAPGADDVSEATAADLTPGGVLGGHPVRVWFPTLDGSPQHAQMLTGCGRYPLVLLAHGSCPQDEDGHHAWSRLPAVLARSGYVVVVPRLRLGAPSGNTAEQRLISQLASWARTGWQHADHVMPAPATALVGHSWGAGLMGHVAMDAPSSYAALVSLSGVEVPGAALRSGIPKLLAWGDDLSLEVLGVQLGLHQLTSPAHVAEFHGGGHWDYVDRGRSPCENDPGRGDCPLTTQLAAEIVACFLTRYLRPPGVPHRRFLFWDLFEIPRSLRPPYFYPLWLTDEQRFYAGGHLMVWNAVAAREGCGVTLRWKLGSGQGELVHG